MIPLLLVVVGLVTPPQIAFDPQRSWFTLETEHFSVHFSSRGPLAQQQELLARQVGAVAEEVRTTLLRETGVEPSGRVQVVIADVHDFANGWAAPLPHNVVTIIPVPPAGDRTNNDDWLRTLLIHEYSHIVQLEMAAGPMLALRRVFGRVVMPNSLMPAWLTEGYAVCNETRFSGFGRARSAEFDATLRATSGARGLLTIDQCSGYDLQRYPAGNAPYLYGGAFMWQRSDKHGFDWHRYNVRRARSLPFTEDFIARGQFGRSLPALWRDWQSVERAGAESVAARLCREPITAMGQLTIEGFGTAAPCWSADGREVYYVSNDGREFPSIKAAAADGSSVRVLHRGVVSGSMGLSKDGGSLFFGQYTVERGGEVRSDIYRLDLVTRRARRLTRGMRARDPDPAPDSTLLVFVAVHDGRSDVVLLELTTGEMRNLTDATEGESYHCPRFSPGGRWVAVGVSRPGGYADIELIDRNTGWTMPVTNDRANDLWPCWSRTGRYLFFVSDRTGVYNLYAFAIDDRRLYRCTNSRYGCFEPSVGPGARRMALVSRSPGGNDIALMDVRTDDWQPAGEFDDTVRYELPAREASPGVLYYYSSFPTVLPQFWLPWVRAGDPLEVGAFTLGWDVLQFHQYAAVAGYRLSTGSPFLIFSGGLNRYYHKFSVALDADLTRQMLDLSVTLPWAMTGAALTGQTAVRIQHDSAVTTGASASAAFSNAHKYRWCVAPTEGRIAGFLIDGRFRRVGGATDRCRVVVHWTEYLGWPRAVWSMRCRVAVGVAFGDSSRRDAFSVVPGPGLLAVRGLDADGPSGSAVAAAGWQFRVPLFWPERGIGTLPIFLRNVNAAVFVDAAAAAEPNVADMTSSARCGAGCELRADLSILHHVPLQIAVGGAVTLVPLGRRQFYARLESELLSSLFEGIRPKPEVLPEPE